MAFNKKVTVSLLTGAGKTVAKDFLEDSITRGLVATEKAAPKGLKAAKGLVTCFGLGILDDHVDNMIGDFLIDGAEMVSYTYTGINAVGAVTTFCSAFKNCSEEDASALVDKLSALNNK